MHVLSLPKAPVDLHKLLGIHFLRSAAFVTILGRDPTSVNDDGRAIDCYRVFTLKCRADRNLATFVTVEWIYDIESIISKAVNCLLARNKDFLAEIELADDEERSELVVSLELLVRHAVPHKVHLFPWRHVREPLLKSVVTL